MNIYTSHLDRVGQQVPETRNLADIIKLVTSGECKESVQKIREADEDTSNKLKRKLLPLFFPTVQIFNKNSLADDSVPTGIVQFDIDTKDNPDLNFDQLKAVVRNIPETIYAFESPREGLKFGILTDFKKNHDEDICSLKNRYKQAYRRSLEYVQKFITVEYDEHMVNLKYACFLSWDQDAYHNPDCSVLTINYQCIYKPPQIIAASEQDVSTEQIEQLLKFIPRDFKWGERQTINYAVFSCIGRAGISILFNHWTTSDRDKLARNLESQYQSMKYGSYGHLVEVAKQHGYKPTTGKSRKTLLPTPCDFKFESLVPYDEGMAKLDQHLQSFFETGKSTLINVSTGAGKTEAVIQFLKNLPKRNNRKRHNRKRVLVLVKSHKQAEEYKQRLVTKVDLNDKAVRVNHIQGKKTVCQRKKAYLDPYYDAGVQPPIEACTKICDMFNTCPYIGQFDDMLTNIRVMTHSELVNTPSAWLYGSKFSNPRKGGWKPDYIIVDEDWLTKKEYEETYDDTKYQSIRDIIHLSGDGVSLSSSVDKSISQLTKDYVTMKAGKEKQPKFYNARQFIADSLKKVGTPHSLILERLADYAVTGEVEYIKSIRLDGTKLRASILSPIADRYKDTPTLFLDATADEAVVKQLIGVDFHSVVIKPNDGINLYQLQGRTMLKKEFSNKEGFRNQMVVGLKALAAKYDNVGLISYKSIKGVKGNFSQWLGNQCGIQNVGHFGNIRGTDQFKGVDCLLVVGRYLIPDNDLNDYCYGVFGQASTDKEYADVPVRMKGGSSMALNNRPFVDARMRRVKKHFSDSETIQAIGRARLIHGNPKDIYLFSHESLGADVEVTGFFELSDFIDSQQVIELKKIGYCHDKPKNLHDLGYPKSRIKEKRDQIDAEITKAGVNKITIKVKDSNRNTRSRTYYVYDMAKLEQHIADDESIIMGVSFE